jgi:membrane protein DedA with SNARE-associated domain
MESFVSRFGDFSYPGIFFGLLLCGFGLPLPEEVFLVAGGLLVYAGHARFEAMVATAAGSILLGDSLAFWLGRHQAYRILRLPFVRKVLGSAEKLTRIQAHFDQHAFKTIFVARFLPGVRAPTYFFAGGHAVPFWKFLAADILAAAISVPLPIWLAWYLGANQEHAKKVLHEFDLWLIAAAVIAVAAFVLRRRWKKRAMKPGGEPTADDQAAR